MANDHRGTGTFPTWQELQAATRSNSDGWPAAAAVLSRDSFLALAPGTFNRRAAEIERLSEDVAFRVGLLHPENRKRFHAFNSILGYVYPAAQVDRGLACSLWCNWLFFFDDVYDESWTATRDLDEVRARMTQYLYLLHSGTNDRFSEPLERLTVEFRDRAIALGGEAWMLRFCKSTYDYLFLGVLPAIRNWRAGRVPTLSEYVLQREHDTAVFTALDLIEIADDLTLPREIFSNRDFVLARRACARAVGFFNDIVSYPKEVVKHENPNNLVHVLMKEHGIDLRRALLLAVDLTNEAAADQLRLSNRIASTLPPGRHPVRDYLDAMRAWQRGNIDFSLDGARYAAVGSPLSELALLPACDLRLDAA